MGIVQNVILTVLSPLIEINYPNIWDRQKYIFW